MRQSRTSTPRARARRRGAAHGRVRGRCGGRRGQGPAGSGARVQRARGCWTGATKFPHRISGVAALPSPGANAPGSASCAEATRSLRHEDRSPCTSLAPERAELHCDAREVSRDSGRDRRRRARGRQARRNRRLALPEGLCKRALRSCGGAPHAVKLPGCGALDEVQSRELRRPTVAIRAARPQVRRLGRGGPRHTGARHDPQARARARGPLARTACARYAARRFEKTLRARPDTRSEQRSTGAIRTKDFREACR